MDKRILFHGWALLSSSLAPILCVSGGQGLQVIAPPLPLPVRSLSALSQSSMNARGNLCAEENPELERIPVTEANGPIVK